MLNQLEDFAAPTPPVTQEPVENLPGFDAGFSAGRAAAEASQSQIETALLQHLDDIAFGFAEARQSLIESLEPCITALVTQLLPDTTETRFLAELRDMIVAAAGADMSRPVAIRLAPEQADAVREILVRHGVAGFSIKPDPDRPPNTALIATDQAETALDIAAMTDRLADVLAALTPDQPKEKQHG